MSMDKEVLVVASTSFSFPFPVVNVTSIEFFELVGNVLARRVEKIWEEKGSLGFFLSFVKNLQECERNREEEEQFKKRKRSYTYLIS